MKILIIGNGFDLNLGLKTSYKDFIQSDYFKALVENKNSMAEYFNEKNELNNWVDIEKEITEYSHIVRNEIINFKEDFLEIKIALIRYLKKAQEKNINQNSNAFKIFKKEIHNIDRIYNFNYTDSIFKISEILNIKNIEKKHCHIHGSINEDNIIFGVEDNAGIKDEHIFFRKAYSKDYGKYNIKNEFNKENEIIIFGHSLGITDSSYFKNYINKRALDRIQTKFKFYHYGEEGYDEMIKIIDTYTNHKLTEFRANNFEYIDSSQVLCTI